MTTPVRQELLDYPEQKHSPRRWFHWLGWLIFPAVLVGIHTALVLDFASMPFKGAEADSGAMAWLLWVYADLPLGLLSLLAAGYAKTNAGAVACFLFFGGLQWFLWGCLIQFVAKWIVFRR